MQLIEPMPIRHIETLWEMELRLIHRLVDTGGCQYPSDDGVCCYFLGDAREVLRRAIGRAWGLKGYEE